MSLSNHFSAKFTSIVTSHHTLTNLKLYDIISLYMTVNHERTNKLMYCSKCGKKLDNAAVFCSGCGAKVDGDSSAETEVSASFEKPLAQARPTEKQEKRKPKAIAAQKIVDDYNGKFNTNYTMIRQALIMQRIPEAYRPSDSDEIEKVLEQAYASMDSKQQKQINNEAEERTRKLFSPKENTDFEKASPILKDEESDMRFKKSSLWIIILFPFACGFVILALVGLIGLLTDLIGKIF